MIERLDAMYDRIPARLSTPLTIASGLVAATGTGLVMAAMAYGEWTTAVVAAGVFFLAGLLWHGADHASSR